MSKIIVDGNKGASLIAYKLSQVIPIYPITPSTPMAEDCSARNASGEKNLYGQDVKMIEMQSEAGVAGVLHGSLLSGALSCTFTASQGLLLMLPNMYKIAGEGLPAVIHVTARAVASHALSIFCDHSDVMAARMTGFIILCSSSVQESHDMTLISHMLALKAHVPVLHFMDGFRTSHELQKIEAIDDEVIKKFISLDEINKMPFKQNALNPNAPLQYGTAQNPDVFFQNREAREIKYQNITEIFDGILAEFKNATGREYSPIEIFGNPKAKKAIVTMGSSANTIKQYLKHAKIDDCMLLNVKMFRPFSLTLPASVEKICVLDRTKEDGSFPPLALDVMAAALQSGRKIEVISGRYGLGGKDFTPNCVKAVLNNLACEKPKNNFTVGIFDDLTFSSLPVEKANLSLNNFEIKIFGLGSDGSVSASKSTIDILGNSYDKYVQGYFEYDSRKSGSLTISHLRLSDTPILSSYLVKNANVIMINNFSFVHRYNLLDDLKENGTVIINSIFDSQEIDKVLPKSYVDTLKQKHAKLYIINGQKLASSCGLKQKINIIMETALFKACHFLEFEKAKFEVTKNVKRTFASKGDEVVNNNLKAVELVAKNLHEIKIEALTGKEIFHKNISDSSIYTKIVKPILNLKGDQIKVSDFNANGSIETGTSALEKRGIAANLPKWIKENCIQCGQCVLACPHSALRPILLDEKTASEEDMANAIGIKGAKYKIQLSPLDCTGCGVCAKTCPAIKKALEIVAAEDILDEEFIKYETYTAMPQIKQNVFSDDHAKGLQFNRQYFEFSGACAGCGQTPYIKLATMLFGDKMMIANATGCSSIYSGSFPSCPFSKNEKGCGPAWANSLFEDNAEFGLGLKLGSAYNGNDKKSVWIIGGDGWAYDIGFGGLDHVLASGENVNILVLDNEAYANTGGQSSKSTTMGTKTKLAENGKATPKKNLGAIAMTYPNVYVAQVALGANMSQCIKAFKEAEKHEGVSLIIAYSTCVNQGFDLSNMTAEEKKAVECGYFPIYRYDGEKLELDSEINEDKYFDFLRGESRFSLNMKTENGQKLLEENKNQAIEKFNKLKSMDE